MKNTRKGFVSLLLLIIAVLIGGGVYAYMQKQSPSRITTTQATSTTQTINSQPAISPVIGWKIYRNIEFKYEISYPPDWKIIEYEGIRKDGHVNVSVGFVPLSNPDSRFKSNYSYLSVNVQDNSGGYTLEQIGGGERIEIDGVAARQFGSSPVPFEGESATRFYENSLRSSINAIRENKIYSLIGESYGPNFTTSHKVVDKIMGTFKFIN